MKKLMIVLCIALLMSFSIPAFAGDFNVGVNLKGATDDSGVQPSLEIGWQEDIFGVYGQVGMKDVSGLVGFSISHPKVPVFGFFGAGFKLVDVYYDASVDSTLTETWNMWGHTNSHTYDLNQDYTYEGLGAMAFLEAGLGLDMGPVYTKIGYTNYNGNTVSFSMGASL